MSRSRSVLVAVILALSAAAVGFGARAGATKPSGRADRSVSAPRRAAVTLPTYGLTAVEPGALESLTYGSGAAARPFLVYTPQSYNGKGKLALMVVLHGCAVTAGQQMQATGFNALADQSRFVVMYPDVTQAEVHQPDGDALCWRYYDHSDWTRGTGDPAAVVAMVQSVIGHWAIDRQRVYVVGMSSGSFLVSDLAATYTDVFAAAAEDAGGAYEDWECVTGQNSNISVSASAQAAYLEEGSRARVVPELVIGGDIDDAVPAACATKALLQGLRTDNLVLDGRQTGPIRLSPSSVASAVTPGGGYPYTVSTYLDKYGCPVGERYLVHGMKHFWSGGSTDPTLRWITDPGGPSAAVASWTYMSRFRLGSPKRPCGH